MDDITEVGSQPEDKERTQQEREEEALAKCKELVAGLGLKMKPLMARFDPDGNHLTIFFRSQERVDFRTLLRKMSHIFKVRVELRQIGPRDEVKLIGGIGKCGYPLCCQGFLPDFASVSIRMAKEQDLALNPMKISGMCGRLLCCLAYESKEYAAMKAKMPHLGQRIATPFGKATVVNVNLLKEIVTVKFDDEATKELALDQLT